jgi:MarR family transcriptional repressor of emrRAB
MYYAYIGNMNDLRPGNLLGALVLALHDQLEESTGPLVDHGAAFPAALVSMHWQPGLAIEDLRRILGLSHSGTVRLLNCLESDGSVARKAGKDARTVALHLTAQGRKQVRQILAARQAVMDQALGALSGAERAQFEKLTAKILGGIPRDIPHSDHICRLCDETSCPDNTCPVGCAVEGARH